MLAHLILLVLLWVLALGLVSGLGGFDVAALVGQLLAEVVQDHFHFLVIWNAAYF